jgi:hypothetical protein
LFTSRPATTFYVDDETRCEGPLRTAAWLFVRGDLMNKLRQYMSTVIDWTVTITTIGLALFLIFGTFTLMLWNGDM